MADILTLTTGERLKHQFRRSLDVPDVPSNSRVAEVAAAPEQPTTDGHALYMMYRIERVAQGWEEFKWASMTESQRLVWERVAASLLRKERP